MKFEVWYTDKNNKTFNIWKESAGDSDNEANEVLKRVKSIESVDEAWIEKFTDNMFRIGVYYKECPTCEEKVDNNMKNAYEHEWCPFCGYNFKEEAK